MKVRLLTCLAGVDFVFEVGSTYEGPDAPALVEAGHAEPIVEEAETADRPTVKETATRRRSTSKT